MGPPGVFRLLDLMQSHNHTVQKTVSQSSVFWAGHRNAERSWAMTSPCSFSKIQPHAAGFGQNVIYRRYLLFNQKNTCLPSYVFPFQPQSWHHLSSSHLRDKNVCSDDLGSENNNNNKNPWRYWETRVLEERGNIDYQEAYKFAWEWVLTGNTDFRMWL